jgi:hypothetical protein
MVASMLALLTAVSGAGLEGLVAAPPVAAGSISLDGRLTEPAWQQAQQAAPLRVLGGGVPALQPTILLCRDEACLYLGARLPKPPHQPLRATVTRRDGDVWSDDALEIFLDPGRTTNRYYQFIVNARGTQWDSLGRDPAWNGEWQAATCTTASDHWSVEVAIPFATVGGAPKVGEQWGFNVCWDRQTPAPLLMTWAPLQEGFHEPQHFAALLFPAHAPALQDVALAFSPAARRVKFSALAGPAPQAYDLTLEVGSPGQLRMVAQTHVAAGESKRWTAEAQGPQPQASLAQPQENLALVRLTMAGSELYRAVIPMAAVPPVQVTVRKFLLRTKRVQVEVDASALPSEQMPQQLQVALVQAAGRELTGATASFGGGTKATAWLDVAKVQPGDYQLRVAVRGAKGTLLHETSQPLTIPPAPEWLGNREGISDRVLPPWTPIKVHGNTVSPWGRDYRWGALPFPEQVTTRGVEVLAAPMRLVAVIEGRPQRWQGRGPQFTKRTPARVEFTTRAEGPDASVRGSLWCEYDGCVRCDWQLVAKRPGARLEQLIFEIPYKAPYARLLYHYPGRWGSAFNAGATPSQGAVLGFRPYIWLGDEWRGLAWFCTSDEEFRPADPAKVTEIVPQGDTVLLRINLVQEPVELQRPLAMTFGFEATPIRPNAEDVWDYRIIHVGNYGLEKQPWSPPLEIRWPAQGHLNVSQGTLEAWVRPHFDPDPPVKPDDPSRGIYNRDFFQFLFGGYLVGYYWNIDDRGMRLYVRAPDGTYPVIFGTRNRWQQGEWHHIAVSWGDELRLYGDGQLLARHPYKRLLPTSPENLQGGVLLLGGGRCEMDVDELCISDIQREPRGHLGPLQPDEHTLLLENFDDLRRSAAGVTTVPVKAAAPGEVSWSLQLVDGKFGRAAAFFVPPAQRLTALDMYQRLGIRTICFHEHWSTIQNYFAPAQPDALRSLVKACHAHGIRLLVYYGYELSNIAPEWDLYGDEVLVYPRAGGYHRQPEQRAYICCYESAWQDYLAWAIARTMDEFDMDGVYLDGTANPWACANLGHGCGYVGRDGKLRPTYGFFGAREMMKRIYTIVKTRKPDGLVNVHQSTCMTIPSVGWATSYWDGEQFGSLERTPQTFPTDVLPLDAFRAEFMGHNWGVPAELLCYNRPYTYREALALTLPHDVLVRPGEVELAAKLWKAAEQFGRHQARWLPYWENQQYVQVSEPNLKCSLYSRGRQGALVVVSNLGREPVQAEVVLNLAALQLPPHLQGTDVVSEQAVPCEAGRLRFPLESMAFKVIWLRPAQKGL